MIRISNRVNRNISAACFVIGILCTIGRTWDVIVNPDSGKAWFQLCGIVFITIMCFDSFWTYRKRVKRGIKFGSEKIV